MKSQRPLTLGAVLATVAASALVAAPIANAAGTQADKPQPAAKKTTTRMSTIRVTGLVTETPDAAGKVKVALANGKVVAIPAGDKDRVLARAAEQTRVSPDNVVVGDCGESSLFLHEKANNHPVRIETGFKVVLPAIAYGWEATITGVSYDGRNTYDNVYDSSGGLAFRTSWDGSFDSPRDQFEGTYSAAVVPDFSWAELLTGDICVSGGPTDTTYLNSPDRSFARTLAFALNGPAPAPAAGAADVSGISQATSDTQPSWPGSSGRVSPFTVFPPDSRTRISDTTLYPNSAVALLHITNANGTTDTCTGFLYAANTVATAGHCVYDVPTGGWASKIEVVPGNDVDSNGNTLRPFGSCLGTTAYTTRGFLFNDDDRYDYGAVKLNCSVGNQTGWFGMRWTTAPLGGTSVTITGYPGDKSPDGSMWTASGPINSDSEREVFYTIDAGPGQSGSPVYTRGCGQYCALAVDAAETATTNSGTRITQAAFDNYQKWKS
jgi:glutamyl endopeptidase